MRTEYLLSCPEVKWQSYVNVDFVAINLCFFVTNAHIMMQLIINRFHYIFAH